VRHAQLLAGKVAFYQPSELIFCFGSALILAALAVFLDTDQNPLDCAAAGSTLVYLKLISQAVEETRFHENLTICRLKR